MSMENKANHFQSLIEQKEFSKAKNILLSDKEISKPLKAYNLGYIEYIQGNYVDARILLESAKSEGLYSVELIKALDEVKQKLQIVGIEDQSSAFEKAIIESLSYSEDLIFSLISVFGLIAAVCFYFSRKIIAIIPLAISLVIISYYLIIYNQYQLSFAVNEANIHEGPSRIFEQTQRTLRGMRIVVDKVEGDWSHIKYPEQYSGWAYKLEDKKL